MFLLIMAGMLSAQAAPPASWNPVDDPLAPARQGLMLCSNPDHDTKLCSGIISFAFESGGPIAGRSWTGVESYLPVSIQIKSKVEVKNSEFCFHVAVKDVDDIVFFISDAPAKPGEIELLENDVRTMLANDIAGKQVCHRHFVDGNNLMARVFVDGEEDIDAAATLAWIDKAAGYRLLPADQMY
jgi:hypothetical protein